MPGAKYDKSMTVGEIGRRLYIYWCKVKYKTDDPVFLDYKRFYNWSLEKGYVAGSRLFRDDITKPYSTENCVWVANKRCMNDAKRPPDKIYGRKFAQKWDEAVNRIRVHYGMSPIYSSEEFYEQE